MWPAFVRVIQWIVRGSDSSSREHFDAIAHANRTDFTTVVAEWRELSARLNVRITELEQRETELEQKAVEQDRAMYEREQKCIIKTNELERRIICLENVCRTLGASESDIIKGYALTTKKRSDNIHGD